MNNCTYNNVGAAGVMAPACISAISGNAIIPNGLRPAFLGEDIFVHKNYVELRPFYPHMETSKNSQCPQIKSFDEKSRKEVNAKYDLHYEYRENRYDFDKFPENGTDLEKAQYLAMISSESRIYAQKDIVNKTDHETRGIITNVSKKSATRLKKFLASVLDLGLWIDFTFPDDVMIGKTLAERRDFANECLQKLKRYLHSIGLKEIWKKEFTDRKSGKLKGFYLPHYHIALTGLSQQQAQYWQLTCIKILTKWVDIIGTDDDNALVVACHRRSFRQIHHSRQAISYIGKYFGKTNEVEDENGEVISIGRAWGYAKVLKSEIPPPCHLFLNKDQSIQFRRFLKKYKQLKSNKKFIGVYEQIVNGYSTFLFADQDTLIRFLDSIGVDCSQVNGVPF
ncbi:hypothetical protein [Desulfobacter vibrioformis]|uniref:hypothetical protein n=1 Tax=Desulfobacter vibrioformis TaxID=34031 RepID=UPI00054E090B|nr:hypothetical protein [Desulfobacter vibrioformis]